MFIEVCLIQKLALFLGYPSYSLTVTLFSLLISSGVGSLLSDRYSSRRNRAFAFLFAYLVALILALQFAFPVISELFVRSGLAVRVVVAVICLAPVGLGLGAFMPIGIKTVSSLTVHRKQYVAWAWAVNGFFSVVASVLSTILSMTIGFNLVFLLALVIYAVGMTALSRTPEPVPVSNDL
jgi:MFS family permease